MITHQKSVDGRSHRHTCLPFLPKAGIALPISVRGDFRVVRVRRHEDPCATATDFVITAVAFPSSAKILPIVRMSIRRYLDGLTPQALIILDVSAIAVPVAAERIQIGIRRHSDRHTSFFDLAKSSHAIPASIGAGMSIPRRHTLVGL